MMQAIALSLGEHFPMVVDQVIFFLSYSSRNATEFMQIVHVIWLVTEGQYRSSSSVGFSQTVVFLITQQVPKRGVVIPPENIQKPMHFQGR